MLEPLLRFRAPACLLAVLALGACEDPGDDTAEAGDESEPLTCEDDERAEAFTVNLAKMGERHTVTIVEAVPAEPIRGDNAWTVMLSDSAGNPEEGATLGLRPWMPDHGHGTPVEAQVTELGAGEYEIRSLNLFMAGLWEVTVELSTPEGEADSVMFSVCIL
jgi:hypothetical protein